MVSTKVKSPAKVNLSLNIAGAAGGYHQIDSVVASVDVYDTICLKPRTDKLVNVYMHGAGSERIPRAQNNAVLAGEAFVAAFDTGGADIEIYKDIPQGAGLGGSSADAAGVLNAMAKCYRIRDALALKSLADGLGSDTGYMLCGGFARISGRGERVERLASPRVYHMLLFWPDTPVSTAACYRAYDDAPDPLRADSARLARALVRGDFAEVAANVYNALQRPAAALNPAVKEALAAAAAASPAACAVTGSGSAVFALFESEELCRWAKSRYRGKLKTRVVRTVEPDRQRSVLRNPFVLGRTGRLEEMNQDRETHGRKEP